MANFLVFIQNKQIVDFTGPQQGFGLARKFIINKDHISHVKSVSDYSFEIHLTNGSFFTINLDSSSGAIASEWLQQIQNILQSNPGSSNTNFLFDGDFVAGTVNNTSSWTGVVHKGGGGASFETGTWEPTVTWFTAPVPGLYGEAGSSQATQWFNNCTYSKIGNVVTVKVDLIFQFPVGVIGSGTIGIAGLPYPRVGSNDVAGSLSGIGRNNLTNVTGDVVTAGCAVRDAWWISKTGVFPLAYDTNASTAVSNALVTPYPTNNYFFQGSLTTPQGNDKMQAMITYITN